MMSDSCMGVSIPTITSINADGRRVMDKENLNNQMMEEDEKAGGLRRKHLTPECATIMAEKTTLTNDVTYVSNAQLLLWHKRVPQLLVKKFWNVPAPMMTEQLSIASEVFVHWPKSPFFDKHKTKKAQMALIGKQVDAANYFCNNIMRNVADIGGFVYKRVHKMDIFSFFVRPVARAFGDETVMEPVEEALVRSCSVLNPHYTVTATKTQDDSDDEMDEYMDGDDDDEEEVEADPNANE